MGKRKQIIRSAKQRGWMLQPLVLEELENVLEGSDNWNADLQAIFNAINLKMDNGRTVTSEVWEAVAEDLSGDVGNDGNENLVRKEGDPLSGFEVVNAFRTPRLIYRPTRKQFHVEEERWSLFGEPEDKTNMLLRRYNLAHQRVLRHKLFRPTDLLRSHTQVRLTPVESLLGKSTNSTFLLLGILVQIEEGRYYLEDRTGQVPVILHQAAAVDECFITEQSIVLVEGSIQDDSLIVHRLGHPLLEERKDSVAAIRQQVSHPAYQPPRKSKDSEAQFVILSDLQIDRPNVLLNLESIFASFENHDTRSMPCFIMMGNFSSAGTRTTRQSLQELASIIEKFPSLTKYAHFFLVPGPRDVPFNNVLPLPPLTAPRHNIQNFHVCSNPCRLRWAGKEMVIFTHNLLHLLQQNQIRLLSESNDTTNAENERMRLPQCRLVKTVLDQGHLCPVAGVPIYWNYDHALQLYPLPDALVLGGDDCERFEEVYGDVDVIHPGSVANSQSYAVYRPGASRTEGDGMADDDSLGEGYRTEFFALGNHEDQG